jgi:glycosyltransferase involved in cell wall biosynthesis
MQPLERLTRWWRMVREAPETLRYVQALERERAVLQREKDALIQAKVSGRGIGFGLVVRGLQATADYEPWRHPFLRARNIRRFRQYSHEVCECALAYVAKRAEPLSCAFTPNLVQNMYKWARLAQERGVRAELVLNDMDPMASSCPEWEEFDGEHPDVFDGSGFLAAHPELRPVVPTRRVPNRPEDNELLVAFQEFCRGNRAGLLALLASAPGVRHEPLLTYQGFYTYWALAKALAGYDVIYAAGVPFAAYFSGRPYCAFSIGGDLSWDCGRADDWGRALILAFNAARFLMVSNPHTLGHCRRLGLTNGVHLPYPMDDRRYSPGEGLARREWEARWGPGPYVLTTARLDKKDKGYDDAFVTTLASVARLCPDVRFLFVSWGANARALRERVEAAGLGRHVVFLLPAGKRRLIDYYRSCDIVLDQLVFGYYGATALEAASIGKPIVMKVRREHYAALYDGDVIPAFAVESLADVERALVHFVSHPEARRRDGDAMRQWLVRTHGEDRTMPVLLALLRVAADRVPLPGHQENPLQAPLSRDEEEYHAACLSDAPMTV